MKRDSFRVFLWHIYKVAVTDLEMLNVVIHLLMSTGLYVKTREGVANPLLILPASSMLSTNSLNRSVFILGYPQ